ncbi:phosphate transport system substrate-binding protein PstS [Candidatus Termititenax dinenymphae]|uniref:Phosphate transport system substrate-binding protein PstS n=1 Tax=Candidatus Termititenax dinenymphae TaxID=2218523 RepID=A0A388TJI4_9BACT|nr:phosphate transport system substrate-binding protein PstS [Candidatus Termititenax dinenymphae]
MKKILLSVLILACFCFSKLSKEEDALPIVYEQHPDQRPDFGLGEHYGYSILYKYAVSQDATLSFEKDYPRMHAALAFENIMEAFIATLYDQGKYPRSFDVLHNVHACTGTSPEAYADLLSGEVDVIFCFEPSVQQLWLAADQGVSYNLTPIGREAFVFFVNPGNPVKSLTSAQVRDIYSGKITNWRTVGGKDAPIRAFQRPKNSGSQTILEKIMDGTPLMTPATENYHIAMFEIVEAAANYRNGENALGYSFLSYATNLWKQREASDPRTVKLLTFDGVAPTIENIRNGTYPFVQDFYAITLSGRETPNTKKFVEWIISPQGQDLIQHAGYVPVHDAWPE